MLHPGSLIQLHLWSLVSFSRPKEWPLEKKNKTKDEVFLESKISPLALARKKEASGESKGVIGYGLKAKE